MKIDINLVPNLDSGEVPIPILKNLIQEHQKLINKYDKLEHYYKVEDTIKKSRILSTSINNKTINGFAKFITDINSGYSLSNKVNYIVNDNIDIQPIIDDYNRQTISSVDKADKKSCSKFGKAYEFTYSDKEANPKTKNIDVRCAFIVKDNTIEENELFGVYYYPIFDKKKIIRWSVIVATKYYIIEYETKTLNFNNYIQIDKNEHFFNDVPITEIKNNDCCLGDYEVVVTLIDAYNKIMSNDVDNIDDFVDAILVLYGSNMDAKQRKLLQETKGLNLKDSDKAEYLTKTLDEAGIDLSLDRISSNIHKFSMTPDITDDEFSGNASGVSLRYKLLPFEMATKDKEDFFEVGLRKRFKMYNYFDHIKFNMPIINLDEIEIKFTHGMPKNDLETAEMINYLSGKVTNKTLISNLSFIQNANEEDELIKKEKEQNIKMAQNGFNTIGQDEYE